MAGFGQSVKLAEGSWKVRNRSKDLALSTTNIKQTSGGQGNIIKELGNGECQVLSLCF